MPLFVLCFGCPGMLQTIAAPNSFIVMTGSSNLTGFTLLIFGVHGSYSGPQCTSHFLFIHSDEHEVIDMADQHILQHVGPIQIFGAYNWTEAWRVDVFLGQDCECTLLSIPTVSFLQGQTGQFNRAIMRTTTLRFFSF